MPLFQDMYIICTPVSHIAPLTFPLGSGVGDLNIKEDEGEVCVNCCVEIHCKSLFVALDFID